MKFGITYSNVGPFLQPENLENLARTADEVGIESIFTVEHLVIPRGYKSIFPYSDTGKMPLNNEAIPIQDPVLPLVYAASFTKKLRLVTGVLLLPQRHPFYVAKQMATLDVLSRGRAILGVGIGWLKEEFDALGIPFRERAGRTEEAILAIRSLWSEEPSSFNGKFFRWNEVYCKPKPVQSSGVPIIIGGQVEAAARRAARLGDGFYAHHGGHDLQEIKSLIAAIRDECGKIGRNPEDIELTVGAGSTAVREPPATQSLDKIRRYEDLGVSRIVLSPPAYDSEGVRRGLIEFGERILSKL